MAMLFWPARAQELRSARWSANAAAGRNQRRCFVKAMLYLGVYLIVWVPIMVCWIFTAYYFPSKTMKFIEEFFLPLQGLFSALVYSDFFRIASVSRKVMRSAINQAITRLTQSLPNTPNFGNTGDASEHGETNTTPSPADAITTLTPSLAADDKGSHIDEENQDSDTAPDST